MANLRDIKRRIKSVRNTSQITKAMQMVASAKMRRAQELALKGRAYISAMANVLRHLGAARQEGGASLMQTRDSGRTLVVVVNTDKGLCGALNANLLRDVLQRCPADADYVTIGATLRNTLARCGRHVTHSFSVSDAMREGELKPIFEVIRTGFEGGLYNRVVVAYQKFINVMVQRPQLAELLPVTADELLQVAAQDDIEDSESGNFLLEPSPEALLSSILPLYVTNLLVQMVLEGKASEQSARMVAMKSATENAKTLIGELTLEYNKARQTQITNELLEITTAMKAME